MTRQTYRIRTAVVNQREQRTTDAFVTFDAEIDNILSQLTKTELETLEATNTIISYLEEDFIEFYDIYTGATVMLDREEN